LKILQAKIVLVLHDQTYAQAGGSIHNEL